MATTPASPPPSSTSPSTPAVSPSASPPPPPSSPASSPPQSSSSPPPDPPTTTSPPPQTSANPPGPATPSPPPQSPPPSTSSSPPPQLRTASPQPPPPTSNSASPPPSQMSASPPLSPPPPTVSSSNPPQTSPPPPQSTPPPSLSTPPPRSSPPPPPKPAAQPPQSSPSPPSSTPPPSRSSPPPPSTPPTENSPPPRSPPPPPKPAAQPPQSSPSPPSSTPPPSRSSPPPPSTPPTENSPPPRSPPPQNSTSPPPSAKPPKTSPPPPPPSQPPSNLPPPPASAAPPKTSPPPPASAAPPKTSPPPPASAAPPKTSPPPPSSSPPESAPPPPTTAAPTPENAPPPPSIASPNPPASPPTASLSNSTPKALSPSPVIRLAPPPSSLFPPSSVNGTDPSASENSEPTGNGGLGTGGVVGILVALSVVLLSLIGLGVWCLRKRRKEVSGLNGGYVMPSPLGSSPSPTSDSTFTKTQSTALLMVSGSSSDFVFTPSEPGGLGNSRSWFTYEELVKATNGFSSQNLLGEGGFGSVYYGCLPDGRELAVKQLNAGGGQGEREFKAEVEIISRIHHRHLVSLVGYCITENQRLLIYDYVPNNTLHFHLHGEGRPVMDWPTRVKIAAGAARGIAYLHEDCHPRIIHRDIKSSNILLDNNFEAKVSDFGLAKLALDANTHITTRVMGTFGYVAPEYASSGKLTEKSDVFSYGVVLLELITGRKPVDPSQPMGDESLVEWARPLLSQALDSEEYEGLVDPRLGKNYVESELFQMIEAAAACVRHSAAKRPRMGQVVRAFDNLAAADLTNGMRVGESEVFNSAQQSAQIRLFQRMAFGSQNYSTDFFSQGSSDSQR